MGYTPEEYSDMMDAKDELLYEMGGGQKFDGMSKAVFALGQSAQAVALAGQSLGFAMEEAKRKGIELEEILHYRGSVAHFMGYPVSSWEDVDKIEHACKHISLTTPMSYHDVCNQMATIMSRSEFVHAEQREQRLKAALKELRLSGEVVKENVNFGSRVSARQARRAAQHTSFTKQLKKSLNEQKGK